MSQREHKPGAASRASEAATQTAGSTPGKRTRVEAELSAVQLRSAPGGGQDASSVHAAAARGVATPASPLPHGDALQRVFGRYDVSSIQAHTGGEAAASARQMGAEAYATGNHVVLGSGADLATVAHEAAHVVQQRGGVQLQGGVGEHGDEHERHADEVAALAVQGKSAESLLDRYAGGRDSGAQSSEAIQHKLMVGTTDEVDVEVVWSRIGKDPRLASIQDKAKQILTEWIQNKPQEDHPAKVSSNRSYANDEQLITALAGEVSSAQHLALEGELAQRTINEKYVNIVLGTIFQKLQVYHRTNHESLPGTGDSGRYGNWTYESAPMAEAVEKDPGDLRGRISIISDYALAVRKDLPEEQTRTTMRRDQQKGRPLQRGVTNANEGSEWVQDARAHGMPVSAGPSATTDIVLTFANVIGCGSQEEKTALAWALFALWNGMPLHLTGTHRFHEVMDVAANHGVEYQKFTYSDPPRSSRPKL